MKKILRWAGALFLLAIATTSPNHAQSARRPNVVFILSDDMGYADIGSYGARDIRTPHLDRLAREGVRLTQCYSNGPVCTPTRAAFVTGRYQQRVNKAMEWAVLPDQREDALPLSETTIARMLKDDGYATALIGKWHLGYPIETGPNAHGFDEYFGIIGGNADMYSHENINGENVLYENRARVKRAGYLTEQLSDRAAAWIEQRKDGPFFLYLAYNAVHWPFQKPGHPEEVRNRQTWFDGTREDYARMLESMDTGIGKVMATLDRLGLAKDTLVVFTNDNGGERLSSNEPFFHHKATLWEGGIRVPGILRWPGRLPAGRVSTQTAITMDFTATILAATGTTPARALDGIDLLPILRGRAPLLERTLFWRIITRPERQMKAVRKGDWKYVRDGDVDLLFDLSVDPRERHDQGYRQQARVRDMQRLLAEWERQFPQ
jgi:arylsulfatase A-like enzyme